ncbi:hypothetical protein RE431_02775 [Christiangramia sp. SM2212]|uniref:ATP-binding protein n=1 Tax=Christiangramia sediminicola TaxID=3073267 RepID=A0ABU1EMC6_9FLAO|nr:hypothetical protein [Christiangramia sp. SM2212]
MNKNIKVDDARRFYEEGSTSRDLDEQLLSYKKGLKISKKNGDSLIPYFYEKLVYTFNKLKSYQPAIAYSDSLLDYSISKEDIDFQVKAYLAKSETYRNFNKDIDWFKSAFRAKSLASQSDDDRLLGLSLIYMASAEGAMEDFRSSQETATKSLQYLDEEKDSIYISAAYDLIGRAYIFNKFYKDAIKEFENSLRFAGIDTTCIPVIQNNIAFTLFELGKEKKAFEITEQLAEEASDPILKIYTKDLLLFNKWKFNKDLHIEEGLLSNLEEREKMEDFRGVIRSYEHLLAYYEENDINKALETAVKILNYDKYNSERAQKEAYETLINYSPPQTSKDYSVKYIGYRDSIDQAKLEIQNTFAKIKYDEEKKQNEINQLVAKNKKQDLEAKHLKNQFAIISLLGLLVIGISCFYFYHQKQKHKKEKLAEIYQTETRLSKTIHDELANDIYNLMGKLESEISASEMDKLENIYNRTRDISRKNKSIETDENFNEALFSMLSENTPANTRLFLKGLEEIDWNEISTEKKIVIYRVLQELFINMSKHSDANFVSLQFQKKGKKLNIDYSDNGKGFNPEVKYRSNGIQNVENRIYSIQGNINFETQVEKGLTVEINLPA